MKLILLFLWITIFVSALVARQESGDTSPDINRHLYESALLQVENLILTQSIPDSVVLYLLSDAKSFASERSWDKGYEILKAIVGIYGGNSGPEMEKSEVPSKSHMTDNSPKTLDQFIS